jgi:hypothetical protein
LAEIHLLAPPAFSSTTLPQPKFSFQQNFISSQTQSTITIKATMAPPTKKQKTDDDKSPIVFLCPGQKPDVRLTVFDLEFDVHSVVLKMNSTFFLKFLYSPDKAVAYPVDGNSASTRPETSRLGLGTTETFKYEWVTKVDEAEEEWSLVSDSLNVHRLCNLPKATLSAPSCQCMHSLVCIELKTPRSKHMIEQLLINMLAYRYTGLLGGSKLT